MTDTLSSRVNHTIENIMAKEVEEQLRQYALNIVLPKLMAKFKSQLTTEITCRDDFPKEVTLTVKFLTEPALNPDPVVHR